MATRMNLRSQQTIPENEELIEIGEKAATPMDVVSDIENGGETEEAAKGGKDSGADLQTLLLSFMRNVQESYDSMYKELRESVRKQIQERNDSMKKELQASMRKQIQKNIEACNKFENILQETRLEMRASIKGDVTHWDNRRDQRVELMNREVETVSEYTHDQIQTPIERVQSDKSESSQAQIEMQARSCNNYGIFEEPATPATQKCAAINQGFVVSQEERIFNSDNSAELAEEASFSTDDSVNVGTGLYGCHVPSSISRSQVIHRDFSAIPKTDLESEDMTQQCGGQSLAGQLQLQYGAEEINRRQTEEEEEEEENSKRRKNCGYLKIKGYNFTPK
jgi:hypothetical protein